MRIELPPASWSDTAPRIDEDAHTLTMAAHVATEWVQWQWPADPALCVRVQVPSTDPEILTITF